MIEISDPLPDSEIGYRTLHEVRLNGKYIGYLDVGYLRREDIKLFRGLTKGRLKRQLKPGQPFGVQFFLDRVKSGVSAVELGEEGIRKILEAIKNKFEGLKDQEITVLELCAGKKNILGRGDRLQIPR